MSDTDSVWMQWNSGTNFGMDRPNTMQHSMDKFEFLG